MTLKLWKMLVRWYLGGLGYVCLELLWRGWSHGSMFVVGGICFLLLGAAGRLDLPLLLRVHLGAVLITGVELISGLILNVLLGLHVWSYSSLHLQLLGQISALYFLLWHPVAAIGMLCDRAIRLALFREGPDSGTQTVPGLPETA